MHKQLKKEIVMWMLDNENRWQRVNACVEEFKYYIYNPDGNYLIGGEEVADFIKKADKLLYGKDFV